MSIIIVGVGQAEFDGESSSPLMLPKRLQALGNDPAPKSVCSRLGVCDCFGELAGRDSVFVCIGVCMLGCAPHTPMSQGEEAGVTPPSSIPGSLGRVGELVHWARSQRLTCVGSSHLLASVSSSLT